MRMGNNGQWTLMVKGQETPTHNRRAVAGGIKLDHVASFTTRRVASSSRLLAHGAFSVLCVLCHNVIPTSLWGGTTASERLIRQPMTAEPKAQFRSPPPPCGVVPCGGRWSPHINCSTSMPPPVTYPRSSLHRPPFFSPLPSQSTTRPTTQGRFQLRRAR